MNLTGVLLGRHHASSYTELVVRFSLWAASLRSPPTAREIAARWEVSNATSYRWRNAYLAATGQVHPERYPGKVKP